MPKNYLYFSDAVSRLDVGMWAGLPRPDPVVAVKRIEPYQNTIRFGPRREQAGQHLTAAVLKGELKVYLVGRTNTPEPPNPTIVPVNILKRLITVRGSL